jgi:hypothetical protein
MQKVQDNVPHKWKNTRPAFLSNVTNNWFKHSDDLTELRQKYLPGYYTPFRGTATSGDWEEVSFTHGFDLPLTDMDFPAEIIDLDAAQLGEDVYNTIRYKKKSKGIYHIRLGNLRSDSTFEFIGKFYRWNGKTFMEPRRIDDSSIRHCSLFEVKERQWNGWSISSLYFSPEVLKRNGVPYEFPHWMTPNPSNIVILNKGIPFDKIIKSAVTWEERHSVTFLELHLDYFSIYNRKPASIGRQHAGLSKIEINIACYKIQLLGGINLIEEANIDLIELIKNYDKVICYVNSERSCLLNSAISRLQVMNVEDLLFIAEEIPGALEKVLNAKDSKGRNALDYTNYLLKLTPENENLQEIRDYLVDYGAKPTLVNATH